MLLSINFLIKILLGSNECAVEAGSKVVREKELKPPALSASTLCKQSGDYFRDGSFHPYMKLSGRYEIDNGKISPFHKPGPASHLD